MSKLSAVIITKKTQQDIERCLKSLEFCDEIVVVEDEETRNPCLPAGRSKLEIPTCRQAGRNKSQIRIFQRKLNNDFASQRNFGMEKASGEWILFVDDDEEVTKELRDEILRLSRRNVGIAQDDNVAYYMKRRDYFWGRELKYGEIKKLRDKGIIRLVKKGSGKWEGKVHEIYNLKYQISNIKYLRNYLNHYPHQTIKEFIESVNFYSSLRAGELKGQGKKTNIFEIILFPLGKFIYTYFLKLGFLDGAAGFTYSFMMSFHSFLVRIKLYQKTDVIPAKAGIHGSPSSRG